MKDKHVYKIPSFDFASLYPYQIKALDIDIEKIEREWKRKQRKEKLKKILL